MWTDHMTPEFFRMDLSCAVDSVIDQSMTVTDYISIILWFITSCLKWLIKVVMRQRQKHDDGVFGSHGKMFTVYGA